MECYTWKAQPMSRWAGAACGLIRFAPDREKVFDELMGHMDEAYQSYLDVGYTEEEAVAKVVERMGDAQAVAEQMRMIYRPFWGYMVSITRILRKIATVYLVFLLVTTLWGLFTTEGYNPDDYVLESPFLDHALIINDYAPTTVVKAGGYTISVERIQFLQYDSSEERCANFVLKVQNWNPWLQDPYFFRNVMATDDCGNLYPPRQYGGDIEEAEGREVSGNTGYSNLFVTYHLMWIANIDPQATAITLGFDDYGVQWEIPLTIEGEVAYE